MSVMRASLLTGSLRKDATSASVSLRRALAWRATVMGSSRSTRGRTTHQNVKRAGMGGPTCGDDDLDAVLREDDAVEHGGPASGIERRRARRAVDGLAG